MTSCVGGAEEARGNRGGLPPSSPAPAAPAELTAGPTLALSDSSLGFCYHPGSTRNCVFLSERVRITSTVRSLHWRASSDSPWLLLSATTGTTPAGVRISVDLSKVPKPHSDRVRGAITLSSAGASNSPVTIPVTLNFLAIWW